MNDKRKVSTDALETLGTIIDENQKRDAIHLAVLPAIAGMNLRPGDNVGIDDGKAYARASRNTAIGIVDPFLHADVKPGERFWLVIYPRVITSLRHVWTHPSLPDEAGTSEPVVDKAASEKWLRTWIKNADCPDYDTVMAAAVGDPLPSISDDGPYDYRVEDWGDGPSLFFMGRDAHESIPPEFWTHVEIVTGKKVPADMRAKSFSCSC